MRTYIVFLEEILDAEKDRAFHNYIEKNNFDFWRYVTLNWIILTPDTVSTNDIIRNVHLAYGQIFNCVLEVNINDFGGIFATHSSEFFKSKEIVTPFHWFEEIRKPDFKPKWERVKEDKSKV